MELARKVDAADLFRHPLPNNLWGLLLHIDLVIISDSEPEYDDDNDNQVKEGSGRNAAYKRDRKLKELAMHAW